MSGSGELNECDFRSLVRLLGRVCLSQQPMAARRAALLDGLCLLVEAERWQWRAKETARLSKRTNGRGRRRTLTPARPAEVQANTVMRLAGPGERRLVSMRSTADGRWSCLRLVRSAGGRPFGERERAMVAMVCEQVPWVHEPTAAKQLATTSTAALPPRLREVLVLVEMGATRQQMAETMGLSLYTVRDYLSELYRHFGVRSQPELAKALRLGDAPCSTSGNCASQAGRALRA